MVDILNHGRDGTKNEIRLMRLREQVLMDALEAIDRHGKADADGTSFSTYYGQVVFIARAALEAVKKCNE
jgi:hypothetical protein